MTKTARKGIAIIPLLLIFTLTVGIGLAVYKYTPLFKESIPPVTIPTISSPATMDTYKTTGNFSFGEEILRDHPTLIKGNLQFSYPKSWNLQDWPDRPNYNIFSVKSLFKSNQSKDISAPDEPTKNLVLMDMQLIVTDKSPSYLVNNFKQEIGYDIQDDGFGSIIEDGFFNGYPASFIYQDFGGLAHIKKYPTYIFSMVSPTTVLMISTMFYDLGRDPEYSKLTINEINTILSTVKIVE